MKYIEKFIVNILRHHTAMVFCVLFLVIVVLGATIFHIVEGRRWFDSFYYAFIVMTTVGFGDFTPQTDIGKIVTVLYGMIGIPLFLVGSGIVLQKILLRHIKKYLYHVYAEMEKEKQKEHYDIVQKEKEAVHVFGREWWKKLRKK